MSHDSSPSEHKLTPLPESHDPELERFRLRSRMDIVRVLRDMAKAGELVTVYGQGNDSFLTTVLGVDEAGRLYLDCASDERQNQRILAAAKLQLVGRHYQVRVQFHTGAATLVNLKDGPALAAPLPDSVLRIQRREFYRLTTPTASRPVCRLKLQDGTHISASIVDISLGGIGIIESGSEYEKVWQPGEVITGVYVELPEGAVIQTDIEIRNRYQITLPGGQTQIHVGCKFLQLDPRMNADIQRYIHRMDLERRRLARD